MDGMVRYHLNQLLGKGGVGLVFRAWDFMFQREVALKVLAAHAMSIEQADRRFRIEAKALMALSHQNICPILDFNDEHWYPYIVMPVLEGGDLELWLEQNVPSPIKRVCEIVRTVALAMEHAHRHRVVHRDLKLSNILLDREGSPNVADFGFARLIDESVSSQVSNPGQVFGTVRYMPPEQLLGLRDHVAEPADIYALGIVMFRLLTRRFPFKSALAHRIKAEIRDGITISPSSLRSDVDPRLDAIFFRAVARDINRRFASMEEFAAKLGDFLGMRPPAALPRPIEVATASTTLVSVTTSPLGVLLAEIPRGSFQMGAADGRVDERPLRDVSIERAFLLGVYPVTQGQYKELMGDAPRPEFKGEDTLPMECVTWLDAIKFCNVLSIQEDLRPYYKIDAERVARAGGTGYRLPTEAEWEYACRAARRLVTRLATTRKGSRRMHGLSTTRWDRPIRSAIGLPTRSRFLTCTATFGSGAGIGMERTTRTRRRTPRGPRPARGGSCAADRGAATPFNCGRRRACRGNRTISTFVPGISASASPGAFEVMDLWAMASSSDIPLRARRDQRSGRRARHPTTSESTCLR